MIFKYCTWPSETKDDSNNRSNENHKKKAEPKFVDNVFRCCPCVFRCRKSIGIENNEGSPSTTITSANTTPIIALRLNRSSDTIDKVTVNEEDYKNDTNNQRFSNSANTYQVQSFNRENGLQHRGENDERRLSRDLISSSSNESLHNCQKDVIGTKNNENTNYSGSRSSTPGSSSNGNKAFDVISSSPRGRGAIDSYVIPFGSKELDNTIESNVSAEDDNSKGWSSEESNCKNQEEHLLDINSDRSDDDCLERISSRRKSLSIISNETKIIPNENRGSNLSLHTDYLPNNYYVEVRSLSSPRKTSAEKSKSFSNLEIHENSRPSSRRASFCESPRKASTFDNESLNELRDSSEERGPTSILANEITSFETLNDEQINHVTSRPHSIASKEDYTIDDIPEGKKSPTKTYSATFERRDSIKKLNENDSNLHSAVSKIESRKSKVPRMIARSRTNSNKSLSSQNSDKTPEKVRAQVQQCFMQLDSKDWEVSMKGLKSMSQLTKQHPEQLDACPTGTINRILGRHVRNLRSQVSRAACLAAGDIFTSQIRGIDQDLDNVAGPLLHRTADTNRFLRADSNSALDRMIENLPPQKTILVIVHRGANHQNAIVRAATARLLVQIVDRIGPENAMALPREVRDKLFGTGAKLLIDSNLDARNHTKKMFRKLMHCEGFRKALTDAVPEATLRHIDKTLKSL